MDAFEEQRQQARRFDEVVALREKVTDLLSAGEDLYKNLEVSGLDFWAEEENGDARRQGMALVHGALEGWELTRSGEIGIFWERGEDDV